jgi:DNA-binding NtrC family response regulator
MGEYREDLYYRLKVARIHVPSLQERADDIPLLVEHFRRNFNRKFNREIKGVSSEVEQMFLSYPWPGNIRELGNLMEQTFVRCRQNVITAEYLPSDLRRYFETHSLLIDQSPEDELAAIRDALEQARGNKSEAARLLGMSRRTIYRKMEKYGI